MPEKPTIPGLRTELNIAHKPLSSSARAVIGFFLGFAIFSVAVQIFIVNNYDYENMQSGVRAILTGLNPWQGGQKQLEFYNPPFSVFFLWPMLFGTPKVFAIIGGSLLISFVFYKRAWVGLAWFGTNSILWLIASGGIDMYVIGAGLLLLEAGDKVSRPWLSVILRVIGYGYLLVKPQGGIFIVLFYILLRRDWKGVAVSALVYGLLFIRYWPDWLKVLLSNPPVAQDIAPQTINNQYGLAVAIFIALLVIIARRWDYWQLGGVLAAVLPPYGMPSIPVLLTLASIGKLTAIPMVLIYSALLAAITWVAPPPGALDYYTSLGSFMKIYHLGMIGMALIIAILAPGGVDEAKKKITINDGIHRYLYKIKTKGL